MVWDSSSVSYTRSGVSRLPHVSTVSGRFLWRENEVNDQHRQQGIAAWEVRLGRRFGMDLQHRH